jgi:F-type H+-transporting ATPase subunit delta
MSEAIAKRYVKALANSVDIKSASEALGTISSAFSSQKFRDIIQSTEVSKSDKESFILSLVDGSDSKLTNFLKLLVENDRVSDIPAISKELKKQLAVKNGEFEGLLISNFEVGSDQINDIQENLSKKLGSKINLTNEITDYPGLKVEISDLGIEVGLSTDRVKSQLAEHILKAI